MTVSDAQREVRLAFLGGSIGQLITGAIWLLSAALATFAGPQPAILALVLGGIFIFPLAQLALRVLRRPGALTRENPLNALPLTSVLSMVAMYPLIYAAVRYNLNWFYPAFMIVVGAHYLSFIFLYGMWEYGVLAAALFGGGIAVGLLWPATFEFGGWLTGLILVIFGFAVLNMKARSNLVLAQ